MHTLGGSIILLTNPENELYKLELTLRGLSDVRGQIVKAGEQLLNEEGVRSVLGQAQSVINRITVMSDLEDLEIQNLMDFLADTLAKDIMLNRVKYEIVNPSARDRIYSEVLISCFICMKRANEGGERSFWKGSQQEITTNIGGMPKKQGLLSKFTGWGGK